MHAVVAVSLIVFASALASERHMRPQVDEGLQSAAVMGWLMSQPRYRQGDEPVVTTFRPDGRLAGPRLRHNVELLAPSATCASLRARARSGWVVVTRDAVLPPGAVGPAREGCFSGERPAFTDGIYAVYSGLAQ